MSARFLLLLSLSWVCCWSQAASDLPFEAPDDSVMASTEEIKEVAAWADTVFTGAPLDRDPAQIDIEVLRQDYAVLSFGESCMETPLKLGDRTFEHGLGTHANSEVKVYLPAQATVFKSFVGIDNNFDTQGKRGSVEFSIEIAGREVFRSPTLRGSDPAYPVSVDLPEGAREILLKVDTTPDGPTCDQADWADAHVVLADGRTVWLDVTFLLSSKSPPLSFTYGGISSIELFPKWERTSETSESGDRQIRTTRWDDPDTGLRLEVVATSFNRYPAVEWIATLENRGTQNSPILENLQALDVSLRTGNTKRPAVLHQISGDVCSERSYTLIDTNLETGKSIRLAPDGGRSSNGTFPFFNFEYRGHGLIAAIGWSGQWAASLDRAGTGITRLAAGMERTHLSLLPGERIRTPRILLMPWKGDPIQAHNRFRRLMLFQYAPKEGGHPVRLPIVSQCFDRYSWTKREWATEAGQMEAARFAHEVGCDTHWLDAAWFDGGFPNGVGNWAAKPQEFPNGLLPVSDACHQLGLKFVLWFEPERVAAGSLIAREHPDFVFGGEKGGLFKLNEPEARRWLTDLLSRRISEYGVDIYRNDFNIDPLEYWRNNDAPDRQGITEIRYNEGLYEMWDELLAKHPGLLIDNCSSGGRRIDLETCSRSVPFWRSDTSCTPGHADWNQVQTRGLALYVPLFMACGWTPTPYDFRSSATAGSICQWAYLDESFPMDLAKAAIAEARENRKYWYGDFYPLSGSSTLPDQWMAYQFHRPDLDEGIVLAFRHAESEYTGLNVRFSGLDRDRIYSLEISDEHHHKTSANLKGLELMEGWELRIPTKGCSAIVRYTGTP